jgi:hypothetical protein
MGAKALGHYSPYGSYWAALSLISDGADQKDVEKYIDHVEKWSKQHVLLKPRLLHLHAEIATKSNTFEAIKLFDSAAAEAERQSLLDSAAFINERYSLQCPGTHTIGVATF